MTSDMMHNPDRSDSRSPSPMVRMQRTDENMKKTKNTSSATSFTPKRGIEASIQKDKGHPMSDRGDDKNRRTRNIVGRNRTSTMIKRKSVNQAIIAAQGYESFAVNLQIAMKDLQLGMNLNGNNLLTFDQGRLQQSLSNDYSHNSNKVGQCLTRRGETIQGLKPH